jgi:hypothetical protein
MLWIRIRMDTHHFGNPDTDPHPHQIKKQDPHPDPYQIKIRIPDPNIGPKSNVSSVHPYKKRLAGAVDFKKVKKTLLKKQFELSA